MTRKDFAMLSAAIAAMPSHAPTLRITKRSAALTIADAITDHYPRFDRDRFLRDCGFTILGNEVQS
jgi:hypothetical protein